MGLNITATHSVILVPEYIYAYVVLQTYRWLFYAAGIKPVLDPHMLNSVGMEW